MDTGEQDRMRGTARRLQRVGARLSKMSEERVCLECGEPYEPRTNDTDHFCHSLCAEAWAEGRLKDTITWVARYDGDNAVPFPAYDHEGIVVQGGYDPLTARLVLNDFLSYCAHSPHEGIGDVQVMRYDDDQDRYRARWLDEEGLVASFVEWVAQEKRGESK